MLFIALAAVSSLFQVEGFHIKYEIVCKKEIIITTEAQVEIHVKCQNGYKKYDYNGCENIKIPIYEEIPKPNGCQMYKFDNEQLYGVTVISCEKVGSKCLSYSKKVLTCSYQPFKNIRTWKTDLIEEYLNWEEIAVENGRMSNLKMSLQLENILGEAIHGTFYVGRKARLVGYAAPTPHVAGILVRNCYATNGRDRIPILVAGCGTGTVFRPYANFFTEGLQVYSPYFTMFQLTPWDKTLTFECTFIVCSNRCNGGSCLKNIYRRQMNPIRRKQRIINYPQRL